MTKEERELLLKHRADANVRRRWIDVSGKKSKTVTFEKDGTVKPLSCNIVDTVDVTPGMLVAALEPDNTLGCGKKIFKVTTEPYLKQFSWTQDKMLITFEVKETGKTLS